MIKLLHKVSHFFGWNGGTIESFTIEHEVWVGFKCSTCHEINHATVVDQRNY